MPSLKTAKSAQDERAFFLNGSDPAGQLSPADQGMISTDLFNFTNAPVITRSVPNIAIVKYVNG